MAGAVHRAETFAFSTRTDEDSARSHFTSQFTRESLWLHGCCWPPDVNEGLNGRGLPGEAAAFVSLLRACAKTKDLRRGSQIHDDVVRKGLLETCSDALVTMYAKCGELEKARELLEQHKSRDVTAWTALIAGYARIGQSNKALDCFDYLQCRGIQPDSVTYTCILKACACIRDFEKGKEIHEELKNRGLLRDNLVLGTALVDMYAKCDSLSRAQDVLDMLPSHDTVSWNALIAGYAQNDQGDQAIKCFDCMQSEGIHPNGLTYVYVLKACAGMGAKNKIQEIHDEILRQDLLHNDVMLGTTLIDIYVKWGDLVKANDVLEKLAVRDVVAWNGLIGGFTQEGQDEKAIICFEKMQKEGIPPSAPTYAFILKSCASMRAKDKGRQIHGEIVRQGLLQHNSILGNALVDMYAKFGDLSEAQKVFESLRSHDVVSWSTLISGYVQRGQGQEALQCFESMKEEGFCPNAVTYVSVLKACVTIRALDRGERIHEEIAGCRLMDDEILLKNALVDMYAKCGDLAKAQDVLEKHPSGDVIAWSALIAGYVQEGRGKEALNCVECMQDKGILPDAATYACILKACVIVGDVQQGVRIHDEVMKQGLLKDNVVLANAILDMYCKFGALSKAQNVRDQLSFHDTVSWNILIAGYVQRGQAENAFKCYEQMQREHVHPDVVTLTCLLRACSHLGLVEEGHVLLINMTKRYGIIPNLECHTCIIDLFGRAGQLEKVVQLMQELPSSHCSEIWLAILSACQKWGNVNVAMWAFEHARQVGKIQDQALVLMANILATVGRHKKARIIEDT